MERPWQYKAVFWLFIMAGKLPIQPECLPIANWWMGELAILAVLRNWFGAWGKYNWPDNRN